MHSSKYTNSNFYKQEVYASSRKVVSRKSYGRRAKPRKKVHKSCLIIYDRGKNAIHADLIDISITGCRLELSDINKLTDIDQSFETFLLKVVSTGLERHFKVVWRANNQIGATCVNL